MNTYETSKSIFISQDLQKAKRNSDQNVRKALYNNGKKDRGFQQSGQERDAVASASDTIVTYFKGITVAKQFVVYAVHEL